MVIARLLIIAYIIFQSPKIQTFICKEIADRMSEKLNTKVEIKGVDISLFNKLVLEGVCIEDRQKDTIIYVNRLYAGISSFRYKKQKITISKILLKEAIFKISTDSLNNNNFQFILDALKSNDTTKTKSKSWNITCNNFEISKSRFYYKKYKAELKLHSVNFEDLQIFDIDFIARNIVKNVDTITFNLKNLSFKEKSGFIVNNFSSKVLINNNNIKLNNLKIITANSRIISNYLYFKYNSIEDFNEFVNNVNIDAKLHQSDINFSDIAYFSEDLYGLNLKLTFSGLLKGKVSDFKAKKVEILFGNSTKIKGNFNITGLPDINQTFMFLDFKKLVTNKNDIEKIQLPPFDKNEHIKLSSNFNSLGNITYKGNFTGLFNDFVAYGDFSTGIGEISSDLLIKKDSIKDKFDFSGNIKTQNFDLGKFLSDNDNFGILSVNAKVDGNAFNKHIYAKMDGLVSIIEFKKYKYQNVKIEGELSDNKFDGFCSVNDPNIKMEFLGRCDFSTKKPVFDFTADVSNAKLFKLNFYKTDSLSSLSFYLDANFTGSKIDDIAGRLELYNTKYKTSKGDIKSKEFLISKSNRSDFQSIKVVSDIIDAQIEGNFNFSNLIQSFKQVINNYIPAYFNNIDYKKLKANEFTFNINLKQTKTVSDIFLPYLVFDSNTTFSGKYNSENNSVFFDGNSPKTIIKDKIFNNLTINASTNANGLYMNVDCKNMQINEKIHLNNIKVKANAKNNLIDFKLNWDNNDSVKYSGNINTSIKFIRLQQKNNPQIDISVLPSSIVLNDTLWNIEKCNILIDSSDIFVSKFCLNNKNQIIDINGKISNNKNDSLYLNFQNVQLSNLNLLTKEEGFEFTGLINGRTSVSDLYNNMLFYSNLSVDSLTLNSEKFGNFYSVSNWNYNLKKIDVSAYTKNGNIKTIDIEGSYYPESNKLDFDVELVKFNLHIFEKFLKDNLTDLRGIVGGNLKLSGTFDKPLINGKLKLQKTAFTINYLQTRYNLTSDVDVSENNIILKDVPIYDTKVNKAIVNAKISHNNFKDFKFDVSINTDNFMFLNTTEKDNSLFYGNAFMSGIVKINGTLSNIIIDISAKTEKHTRFFIPLSKSENIQENDFITFVNNKKDSINKNPEYNVDLSGIQLNFDLEVTPDAEVQILFDPKIGDIIKEKGSGNLKMEINTLGKFRIYGNNVIESGDYLFTLQNIINKKFEIEKGGTIKWNGDPYDAVIDIKAIYKTKAALNVLMQGIIDQVETEKYKQRVAVECILNMTDNLTRPNIKFGINVPAADSKAQSFLSSMSEDEINKQLLSLLVINSFYTPENFRNTNNGNENKTSGNAVGVNSSELLTNQLNHWLSQISNDFDIGVNYRSGDQISRDEAEVALSTQLLNDRISINGNVGVGGKQTSTNNLIGDFNVDVKLNKSGKFRVKAYTKTNDNLIYDSSPSTQGLGFFYREEFDTYDELLNRLLKTMRIK